MPRLSLKAEIQSEQERLDEHYTLPVTSDCGRFVLARRESTYDAPVKRVSDETEVRTVSWSNESNGRVEACEVRFESGETARFSWARYPSWLVRRWVQCFGPSLTTICHRLRREGVAIVVAGKPSFCVWNTLYLRGDRKAIDRVLEETGEKWARRQPPGGF